MRAKWAGKPGSVVDNHLSRDSVTAGLEHATRAQCGPHHRAPIRACSERGLPSHPVTKVLVVSYTTVSAFLSPAGGGQRESSFLRRFPSGHPARPLAGFLPCGARTFLITFPPYRAGVSAIVWPTSRIALYHSPERLNSHSKRIVLDRSLPCPNPSVVRMPFLRTHCHTYTIVGIGIGLRDKERPCSTR